VVLVVVEVVVLVVVEVVVLVVVEVVVLVVVEVVTITEIVLSMSNGLGPPIGPVPSSRNPFPTTAAVAMSPGDGCPPISGIVQGNGPKSASVLFAGMAWVVKKREHGGPVGPGTRGCPIASGQQKLAVTFAASHPISHLHVPASAPVQHIKGVPAPVQRLFGSAGLQPVGKMVRLTTMTV
jgi:hypothetical protein